MILQEQIENESQTGVDDTYPFTSDGAKEIEAVLKAVLRERRRDKAVTPVIPTLCGRVVGDVIFAYCCICNSFHRHGFKFRTKRGSNNPNHKVYCRAKCKNERSPFHATGYFVSPLMAIQK